MAFPSEGAFGASLALQERLEADTDRGFGSIDSSRPLFAKAPLTRISPEEENRPRVLSTILDISEIRDFRKKHQIIEARRRIS